MDVIEIVDRLKPFAVATIYEAAGKTGGMDGSIRCMVEDVPLAGVAFTVSIVASDTLGVWRAIAAAPAGSIMMIDSSDAEYSTVWGGTSTIAARGRDIHGCVTNGCFRDIDALRRERFPTFGAGTSPRGTVKHLDGQLRAPVSIGGVVVRTGDLVFGDHDGVVVVAAEHAGEVLARVQAQHDKENAIDERIRSGEALSAIFGFAPGEA